MDMMDKWDERYRSAEFAYGVEPNDFVSARAGNIPRGRVLMLADGEGRNGVYLAGLGYNVHSVDKSAVGLQKAAELARSQRVTLTTDVADLCDYTIEPNRWDGIVSIFAHIPSACRKVLHRQVVSGLKPGGVFILEAYTPRQHELEGKGGPPPGQEDLLMTETALERELAGLSQTLIQELDRPINEGRFHQGMGAVVQVYAVK